MSNAHTSVPEPAHNVSVLIVDDDEAARRGLTLIVRALGYACSSASDGLEALEILSRNRFDVVLSDWKMPRLDGIGLCAALRKRESEYTYFVFVTGQTEKRDVIEGMHVGADDYLTKPVDVDALEIRLLAAQRVIAIHRQLSARNHELRRDSQRNFQLAHFDALTNVRNRLALVEDMRAAHHKLTRYGTRCAVAMCDVDKFKTYNDVCGHVAGDGVLREIADIMQRALRRGDRLYRYGGEEFVVLLPEQSIDGALLAMQRVRQAVEAKAIPHARTAESPWVTVSIGVAALSPDDDDEAVIQRADAALYRAKSHGRNRVEA